METLNISITCDRCTDKTPHVLSTVNQCAAMLRRGGWEESGNDWLCPTCVAEIDKKHIIAMNNTELTVEYVGDTGSCKPSIYIIADHTHLTFDMATKLAVYILELIKQHVNKRKKNDNS